MDEDRVMDAFENSIRAVLEASDKKKAKEIAEAVAAEREACALLCESREDATAYKWYERNPQKLAELIRARGDKPE